MIGEKNIKLANSELAFEQKQFQTSRKKIEEAFTATSLLLLQLPSFYFGPCHCFRTSRVSNRFRSYNSNIYRGSRSMTDLVKRFASRDGGGSNDGNEQFGALEQDSIVTGTSELRKELVSGGRIDAIVNRLSKWLVSALFGSIILLRHDGAALWAVIGSVANSALSVVLKRILNQERPDATLRSDPGMPSSHAQSISFISVFAVMSVMEWLGTNGVSLFLSGLILALGSYFIWLRVSQKLHTSSQVVVGAIVGSVFCILWYTTWNLLLLEAFQSSLLVQVTVFLAAASFALAFSVYVVLNWFSDDR